MEASPSVQTPTQSFYFNSTRTTYLLVIVAANIAGIVREHVTAIYLVLYNVFNVNVHVKKQAITSLIIMSLQ